MSTDKTFAHECVEEQIGWPTFGAPTNGWMRQALAILGIETRGIELSDEKLVRMCNERGLPVRVTSTYVREEIKNDR